MDGIVNWTCTHATSAQPVEERDVGIYQYLGHFLSFTCWIEAGGQVGAENTALGFPHSDINSAPGFERGTQLRSQPKNCVTRAPLLYFIRSWVALSFKVVSQSVSEWGIGNTCPNLHFLKYIKAWMSSNDQVSSITNCYRLIVSYTDPVHSFIIS